MLPRLLSPPSCFVFDALSGLMLCQALFSSPAVFSPCPHPPQSGVFACKSPSLTPQKWPLVNPLRSLAGWAQSYEWQRGERPV